jgi:CheY-like chemotaxis protein
VLDTRARDTGVRLSFALDAALPAAVLGDAARLSQVLINLVANAVRSTPSGGTVTLSIGSAPGRLRTDAACPLRLTVQDTGVGLTMAQQARLFQPFTQVEGTTSRPTEGTGLGLSICQRLVRAMGGEIQVDSEPGRGSTFWFDLVLPAHTASPGGTEGPAPVATPDARAAAPAVADGRPVLLVEDNPVNLEIAQAMLEQVGCAVHAVTDGQQAVQTVQAHPPGHFALVLMDLQMPVMDGHEAAAALRQDRRHDGLPIVALTAHALTDVRERCLAGGMQDYLVKPVRAETLAAVVRRWAAPA